jgi:hypothetical protein
MLREKALYDGGLGHKPYVKIKFATEMSEVSDKTG